MSYSCHHIDKWLSANLDLIEENFEENKKSVVFISGASSSGKSYCAKILANELSRYSHHPLIISLDSYNFGLSGIIPNKVNSNYYDNKIEKIDEIENIIKKVIYNIPFEDKYNEESLLKIEKEIIAYFPIKEERKRFLSLLNKEWKVLNFDEPSVYDMECAAKDIHSLLKGNKIAKKEYSKVVSERIDTKEIIDGNDYDVLIIEGIYALNDDMLKHFNQKNIITNFIDGNPKTLFLRRIIRDSKLTSAHSIFTISLYFKYIIPSYNSTILPSKKNADVIYFNEMTFIEKKNGDLYTTKFEIKTNSKEAINEILSDSTILKTVYIRDTYFNATFENNSSDNVLRLRSYSDDQGLTYKPSSLVHKGIQKVRKDSKIIRPINVLIKEGEFNQVWEDEISCLRDFSSAGFLIGPMIKKIKWKINYHNYNFTIKQTNMDDFCIEFDDSYTDESLNLINNIIKKYK